MSDPQTLDVGGTTVTLNAETPSKQLTGAAQDVIVTDSLGRSIKLKKPGVLAQFRLVEALGDSAKNEVYLAMVTPMIFVTSIDDAPVAAPTSKAEIEALIQRLDEPGIEAVMIGAQKHFGGAPDEAAVKNA